MGLLSDSGASASDYITRNSAITGTVALASGQATALIEVDLDNNGTAHRLYHKHRFRWKLLGLSELYDVWCQKQLRFALSRLIRIPRIVFIRLGNPSRIRTRTWQVSQRRSPTSFGHQPPIPHRKTLWARLG